MARTPIEANPPDDPNSASGRGNYVACVGAGNIYGGNPVINVPIQNQPAYGPVPSSNSGAPISSFGLASAAGIFQINPYQSFDYPQDTAANLGLQGGSSGLPYQSRIADITDGTSTTAMLSEVISAKSVVGWTGPPGYSLTADMGGGFFSTWGLPNDQNFADVMNYCPGDPNTTTPYPPDVGYLAATAPEVCISLYNLDTLKEQQHAAARSKHPGGVNVTMGDASVHFINNYISLATWQALGTRANAENVGNDF